MIFAPAARSHGRNATTVEVAAILDFYPAIPDFYPLIPDFYPVIPAKAGIQKAANSVGSVRSLERVNIGRSRMLKARVPSSDKVVRKPVDSRFRGNDGQNLAATAR